MIRFKPIAILILVSLLIQIVVGCADKPVQTKKLSVDLIYGSASLWGKTITGVQWMPDAKGFTYYESDPLNEQSSIWYYDLKKSEKTVLLDDKKIAEFTTPAVSEQLNLDSYVLSPTGKELLLTSDDDLFLYNINTSKLKRLTQDPAAETVPQFSPDGTRIAFLKDHNIHVIDIDNGEVAQLTVEGTEDLLVGRVDWVYGEEFGIDTGFFWSPDSRHIAYFKLDQSAVPGFPITDYISVQNEVDITHYPKAGENNSIVQVGVVSVKDFTTVWMDIGNNTDIYIPRIKWLPDSSSLAIQRLNRAQNKLDLLVAGIQTGKTSTILKEEDAGGWIDIYNELTFIKGGTQFIWSSNRSGFKHLYLYDIDGKQTQQLTDGNWEVDDLVGIDEVNGLTYFRATKKASWERHLYRVDLAGNGFQQLTQGDGWHTINMSPDCSYYLDFFCTYIQPNVVSLHAADGKTLDTVEPNDIPALGELNLVKPEFMTFMSDDGVELPAFMIKPPDFNPNKKYPVLMYTYGGPAFQAVCNQWEDDARKRNLWHEMMAQEGYIIFALDNRGTPARGKAFAQAIYRQWGTMDVQDKIAGVKYLQKLPYVDDSRIGIWGWSHGGYLTCMCMLNGADYFRTGIAVAPATDWCNYDTIYTERYMCGPQDNPEGYKTSSALNYVENLRGNLLIVHGTADDNVHMSNTMQLIYALENSRKPFDLMIYPRKKHHMDGQDTKVHLFNLMTDYIKNNL
ncbi:MAG: S9 family peptidase [Dehalococcoidia bacterium]|nr:MAG: S9 family peptidase [Dehalococcoidia bacterium]